MATALHCQVFAYGLDLFFTPFQSAKAYDVLSPDTLRGGMFFDKDERSLIGRFFCEAGFDMKNK